MARREALARPFAALVNDVRDAFRAARRGKRIVASGGGPQDAEGQRQANMNSEDTRNLFLAIALSILVMAAWQYFYAGPLYQREHQAQMQANNPVPKSEAPTGAAPGGSLPATALPPARPRTRRRNRQRGARRELARRHRHANLGGSIDLKGGQLDDLVLKDYHETINKKSPLIRLFSPSGAPNAYWAETGFVERERRKDGQSRHRMDCRRQHADPPSGR